MSCTLSAMVSNRLAMATRFLDAHDQVRDGTLGESVALFAAMTTVAAEACEMLHGIAASYDAWIAEAAS